MSDKLKFKDLQIGDKFIGFPLPGDNEAHGGYKGGHVLYSRVKQNSDGCNARRSVDGKICSNFPLDMHVIKIV